MAKKIKSAGGQGDQVRIGAVTFAETDGATIGAGGRGGQPAPGEVQTVTITNADQLGLGGRGIVTQPNSRRDLFAAHALQALVIKYGRGPGAAKEAVKLADEMIAMLEA